MLIGHCGVASLNTMEKLSYDPPPRRPVPVHPSEEELALRHDEIHRLHADNQLLIDGSVNLRRRYLKLEADFHVVEPLGEEVMQLKSEAQKLSRSRQELSGKVQALQQDLKHLQL
ncbi:hypothetical protein ZIOFF_014426 [Zingiber officinale]|uniref:Uncharacterized protein n=1 Tax=Zingiber officinale TaxID=94328 RepID=A0A8J5HQ29_ZINOF|nr:hypothetical protein ZIOFF_014426 [Zingiber officinale]